MRTLLYALVFSAAAFAQERAIVLRAARLFDGKSDRLESPGVIVIHGGKIQAVGGAAAVPPDSEVDRKSVV